MARYIDKEIICEAYVHLDVDDSITPAQVAEIEKKLKHFFDERVRFLLGESVQTEIKTEDGSLKVTLTAYAGIVALLGGIGQYPAFRDGVKAIYEDSRMLAEATNLETVFVTRTPSCDRLHAEARTGVIGRIAKVVTSVDTIHSQISALHIPSTKADITRIAEITNSITRLDSESRRILEKIQTDDDKFCIAKGLHTAFSQFPEVLPIELGLSNTPMNKSLLHQLGVENRAASEFQRYTATVRSAKEMMKRTAVAAKPQVA